MSTDWFQDIENFRKKFNCHQGTKPSFPPADVMAGQVHRVNEETSEFAMEVNNLNLEGIVSEGIDVIYVILGLFAALGVDPRPFWDAIHQANMNKEGNGKNGAKITKPKGWQPPNIRDILKAQGWEG